MQHPTQIVNREGGCEDARRVSASATCCPSRRTHLDLFSGIGGFALAAQAAGFQTIGFSEIEPYSCAVLKQHWPEIKNYGDIRNIRNVPADLVTGGFPCQPFSVAGKRGGTSDDRALWPEMRRVIAESKPTVVLGENVSGIVSMELDSVLDDLEHLGYSAWPIVVPACAVDARHRRDRVWILGYANGVRSRRAENGQGHHAGNNGDTKRSHELCEPARPSGAWKENVADAASSESWQPAKWEGRESAGGGSPDSGRLEDSRRETLADTDGASRKGNERTERSETERAEHQQPHRWLAESGFCRVADGIPNRTHRLRGLGNAIVPQVAETILKQIARVMDNDKSSNPAGRKQKDESKSAD